MLLVLGVLYWILGSDNDAIILFSAYIPITAIDVALNIQSSKALKALQGTLTLRSKTYRDGEIKEIPIHHLVPSDIIVLEEGQSLPADGIVLESSNLRISEAALTGESLPLDKKVNDLFFAGTTPLSGQGIGKIIKTGTKTKFGMIGKLLDETKASKSPLRKKIDRLVKIIFTIAMIVSAILFLIEWKHSGELIPSLILSLTLGMSAIPEEFPIVFTLYLSLGAWRLSKKNVLVKSLPSVEALGGVDIICTDKTGTLTEGSFELEEFKITNTSISESEARKFAVMACEVVAIDAMEKPIIEKFGEKTELHSKWDLILDNPFNIDTKTMSHVWKEKNGPEKIIAMKGAFEGVIKHCNSNQLEQASLVELNNTFTSQGKRVLALAAGKDEKGPLSFIGLLVYSDPIRPGVKDAIQKCQEAGIIIKIITGDHLLTAHSIADQVGLKHATDELFTGEMIHKMNSDDKKTAFIKGSIFARFSPELKHEMVKALKETGSVVAMTGDGINDGPALRLADIGISMGKSATDFARSAAQMVLIKNDFIGIVEAIFEGRKLFSNLQKSFSYLISFHTPVILLTLIPTILKWPAILMPTHIILLELIVHPVSAFTFENLSKSTKTKSSKKTILDRNQLLWSLLSGTLVSVISIIVFRSQMATSVDELRTMAFSIVVFGNLFFIVAECFPHFRLRFFFTALFIILFAASTTGFEPITDLLHFKQIKSTQLMICFLIASLGAISIFKPNQEKT